MTVLLRVYNNFRRSCRDSVPTIGGRWRCFARGSSWPSGRARWAISLGCWGRSPTAPWSSATWRRREHTERRALALAEESGDEPLEDQDERARLGHLPAREGRRGRGAPASGGRVLGTNREPQADVYVFETSGAIALGRGHIEEALEHFRRGVELSRGYTLDQAPLLFYDLVRLLLRTGDRTEAEGYRGTCPRAAGLPRRRPTPMRLKGSWRLTLSEPPIACGPRRASSSDWGCASYAGAC